MPDTTALSINKAKDGKIWLPKTIAKDQASHLRMTIILVLIVGFMSMLPYFFVQTFSINRDVKLFDITSSHLTEVGFFLSYPLNLAHSVWQTLWLLLVITIIIGMFDGKLFTKKYLLKFLLIIGTLVGMLAANTVYSFYNFAEKKNNPDFFSQSMIDGSGTELLQGYYEVKDSTGESVLPQKIAEAYTTSEPVTFVGNAYLDGEEYYEGTITVVPGSLEAQILFTPTPEEGEILGAKVTAVNSGTEYMITEIDSEGIQTLTQLKQQNE